MLPVIHRHEDSEEPADDWHHRILPEYPSWPGIAENASNTVPLTVAESLLLRHDDERALALFGRAASSVSSGFRWSRVPCAPRLESRFLEPPVATV